eukprot:189588_1
MNGLMFTKVNKKVFEKSIIMYSNSYNEFTIKSFNQLVQIVRKLYKELYEFDLSSIEPSSVCNIELSRSVHNQNMLDDDEKKLVDEAENVPIFKQWIIIFNAQYNRNMQYKRNMFATLLKTYENDINQIINLKYDNYLTPLNE